MRKPRNESMKENREKLVKAARIFFAENGFSKTSMDNLTASVGLTRGALYHNFGDKKGLFSAVVTEIDNELASYAQQQSELAGGGWEGLVIQEISYIEQALRPEVKRIVLLDGPAYLGDPSQWPSQNACMQITKTAIIELINKKVLINLDPEAMARLLSGAAFNAALWVASSNEPESTLPKAVEAFRQIASGLLIK